MKILGGLGVSGPQKNSLQLGFPGGGTDMPSSPGIRKWPQRSIGANLLITASPVREATKPAAIHARSSKIASEPMNKNGTDDAARQMRITQPEEPPSAVLPIDPIDRST